MVLNDFKLQGKVFKIDHKYVMVIGLSKPN